MFNSSIFSFVVCDFGVMSKKPLFSSHKLGASLRRWGCPFTWSWQWTAMTSSTGPSNGETSLCPKRSNQPWRQPWTFRWDVSAGLPHVLVGWRWTRAEVSMTPGTLPLFSGSLQHGEDLLAAIWLWQPGDKSPHGAVWKDKKCGSTQGATQQGQLPLTPGRKERVQLQDQTWSLKVFSRKGDAWVFFRVPAMSLTLLQSVYEDLFFEWGGVVGLEVIGLELDAYNSKPVMRPWISFLNSVPQSPHL